MEPGRARLREDLTSARVLTEAEHCVQAAGKEDDTRNLYTSYGKTGGKEWEPAQVRHRLGFAFGVQQTDRTGTLTSGATVLR